MKSKGSFRSTTRCFGVFFRTGAVKTYFQIWRMTKKMLRCLTTQSEGDERLTHLKYRTVLVFCARNLVICVKYQVVNT